MPKKLLVADDSVTIQKVLHLTFADEDVVVEAVNSGDEVLDKAKRMKPDIILADVFMPGRNGYELCASLKNDPEFAQIPVVLLVGTFEPFDEAEAARVKCDGYLTKPFDTSELIQMVHSMTDQAPADSSGKVTKQVSFLKFASASAPLPTFESLVSSRTRDSFLGSDRILDLFGSENPVPKVQEPASSDPEPALESLEFTSADVPQSSSTGKEITSEAPEPSDSQVIPFPVREPIPGPSSTALSDEMVDAIVEKVVRAISQEVVREIAWEVVPELAERLILQRLTDHSSPGQAKYPVS